MSVTIIHGCSREQMRLLADNSVDAVCTDTPYALESIRKRFGSATAAPTGDVFGRQSRGFMGHKWDTGEDAHDPFFWGEVWRVLKPGGHILAFGGTRTYHRLATAIEDACRVNPSDPEGEPEYLGFEIWDMTMWAYGSGMPLRSKSAAKSIDNHLGTPGEKVPRGAPSRHMPGRADLERDASWSRSQDRAYQPGDYVPGSPEAQEWSGWHTSQKPALEPICVARKPLDGTLAQNILKWGVGAMNIDGCRVGLGEDKSAASGGPDLDYPGTGLSARAPTNDAVGRWPANIVHDGSPEVLAAFPDAPGQRGAVSGDEPSASGGAIYNPFSRIASPPPRGDVGSAARFFYSAKADAEDRFGSDHPTVKPVALVAWAVRLITPPGGVVLDPFAGTGTTGAACLREGFSAILIEREASYVDTIRRRIAYAEGEGRLLALEIARLDKPENMAKAVGADLPLFGGEAA